MGKGGGVEQVCYVCVAMVVVMWCFVVDDRATTKVFSLSVGDALVMSMALCGLVFFCKALALTFIRSFAYGDVRRAMSIGLCL